MRERNIIFSGNYVFNARSGCRLVKVAADVLVASRPASHRAVQRDASLSAPRLAGWCPR